MRIRVWSALFSAVLLLHLSPLEAVGAGYISKNLVVGFALMAPGNNDDDELPDDMDPNDDNDEFPDNLDPAPFDPLIPGADFEPTPDPAAFDEDTDGDGITNNADPDDNNDGVVDGPTNIPTASAAVSPTPLPTEAPATLEPTAVPTTTEPVTYIPDAPLEDPIAEAPAQLVQQAPVVTSLPSTGTGSRAAIGQLLAIMVGVTTLLSATMCRRLARSCP